MSKTLRIALFAVLAVAFVGAIAWRESHRSAGETQVAAEAPGAPTDGAVGALPRLVDLGSTTCVPCKMMAPILDELSREYRERFLVEVIDVRENRSAAELYGIRVIPTQIFFDASGVERFRHEGFLSKEAILEKWGELGVVLPQAAPAEGS